MPSALLLLNGGHKLLLRGLSVSETEDELTDARQENRTFLYFQPTNFPDNGIVVDPSEVVAVCDGGEDRSAH
jgi:hypothetical protein